MTRQIQISRHLRRQRPGSMIQRRTTEPRRQFLSNSAAAHDLAPFEHKRLQSALREIAPSNQTIVSGSNNCDVVSRHPFIRFIRGLNIFQQLKRCISTWRTHDPTTRMRRRPAHVKVFDRRAILRPPRRRSQKEKLLERQLTLKNISFRQTKIAFEIEWRQNLTISNQL